MSPVRSAALWLRRRSFWPASGRDWADVGLDLGILVAVATLVLLSFRLEPVYSLTAWLIFAAVIIILTQAGQVKLFGPVLFYDMVRTARRSRYAAMRLLYACLLLLLLVFSYSTTQIQGVMQDRLQAARLAETYFEVFMLVQIIAVVVLTPAYVAGAIAEEKDRKTLEFILATDLRNREIVLSKLSSRLGNLALFLITGLPILSFLQFLGGIDPNLVLTGFAVTGLTMLGIGSVSILYSALMKRPRDAIAMTYAFILAYLGTATMLLIGELNHFSLMDTPLWFNADPPTLTTISMALNAGNPIALIVAVGRSGGAGTLANDLPALVGNVAIFNVVLSVLCLGLAILRLRTMALRQRGESQSRSKKARGRPPVGELPMLWKEMHGGNIRLGWIAWLTFLPLGFLTLGIGVWIVLESTWDYWTGLNHNLGVFWIGQPMNIWIRVAGTSVAMFTILWAAVRASTAVSTERDRATLDALVTTQLTSDGVLFAKLVGSIVGVRLGVLWFALMLLLALFTGGLHYLAAPLVLGGWLIYSCFFVMLGLWFSMTVRNSHLATVFTVLTSLFLGGGHMLVIGLCCATTSLFGHHGGDRAVEHIMKFFVGSLTPPATVAILHFSPEDLAVRFQHNEFSEFLAYSVVGLAIWAGACLVFWYGLLAPRFRTLMRRDDYDDYRTVARKRREPPAHLAEPR